MCRYTRDAMACGHCEDEDLVDWPQGVCIIPCEPRDNNTTTIKYPGKCITCVEKAKPQQPQQKKGQHPPAGVASMRLSSALIGPPKNPVAKAFADRIANMWKRHDEALKAGKPVNAQHRADMEAAAAAAAATAANNNNNNNNNKSKHHQAQAQPHSQATVKKQPTLPTAAASAGQPGVNTNNTQQSVYAMTKAQVRPKPVAKTATGLQQGGNPRAVVGTSKG
ncbi:hypothetical protein C8A05DRAFT_40012 [Staphylotrichum tortipilum]|uniref:Uncharacterized protein n=1 Tax=Staphylotrichum tortipilum TaxID=2831512 RepID=A0AAN6M9N3_9PEZI|nr:hypothetical protein C8A05DRAFT_40012 [Staphylotrichum longicolle]